jgi:hypothetical protein
VFLVDTSVWIDHIGAPVGPLAAWLNQQLVFGHRIVLGELALGSIPWRAEVLRSYGELPAAIHASDGEVMALIENARLMASGVGWADACLLASTLLTPDAVFVTRDKKVLRLADRAPLAGRVRAYA